VETVVRSWSVENNQAGRSPNRAFFGVSEIDLDVRIKFKPGKTSLVSVL
jgi:hypothetical protein